VVDHSELVGVILVKEFWNLCNLFVAPAMQGRGIGRGLVAAAVERCRGASPRDAIWLVAAPDAAAFYRRLGFIDRDPAHTLPLRYQALQLPLH
jgi:GNAT superfamily N-acetyltransferase